MTTGYAGPLAGVRVLEFAGIGPGPVAAMMLADLGAEVIGLDRPGGAGPFDLPMLRRGRRSVAIDLKTDGGREVVLDLVGHCDLLIEPYRPGVMERLGLGPDVCLARNPKLLYGRMTGWGQSGPLAPYAGHDLTYVAVSGLLSTVGRDTGDGQVPRPLPVGPYLGDVAGGALVMVAGLLAGLLEVGRTGVGQVVDGAICDGAGYLSSFTHALIQAGSWRGKPGHNLLDSGAPFYDVYECADGRHLAVGPLEPQFYAELLRLLGEHAGLEIAEDDPRHPRLRDDPRRWPEAKALWESFFRTRTRDEWSAFLEHSDACVAPVLGLDEAPAHAHVSARDGFRVVQEGGLPSPAPAPRFDRPIRTPRPPEPAGTSTESVLTDLGYAADRIAALRAAKAVS
jgi:alpha-methylacyl-CoA racemase